MPDAGGPHFLLNVRCPSCGSELQFHQTAAGQTRQCRKCKTTFRVSALLRTGSPAEPVDRTGAPPDAVDTGDGPLASAPRRE